MELIDVLDEQGKETGEVRPRKELHSTGLWHRAVHVWILNTQGELLIQKRANVRLYHPGAWSVSVGGHIAAGEKPLATAVREIQEELGLDCSAEELEFLFTVKKHDEFNGIIENEFLTVYLLRHDLQLATLSLSGEEVAEVRWILTKELESQFNNGHISLVPEGDEYEKLFSFLRECSPS